MQPDLAIAAARAAARGGSPVAMRDLANALKRCAGLRAVDEETVVEKEERIGESFRRFATETGLRYDAVAQRSEVAGRIAGELDAKRACAGLPDAELATWQVWLERAAASGDLDAKRDYAAAVLHKLSDAQALFADIDEVAREKKRAFGFMQDVLTSGDCTASTQLHLLAPGPYDAYVAMLISAEWGAAVQPQIADPTLAAKNNAFMQRQVDLAAARVPAGLQASAQAAARLASSRCRPVRY